MTCRWTSSTTPRIIPGRHLDECADRWSDDPHGCGGCLPCAEAHCRVCGRVHADGACAECLAATRADLHEIARLCDALPAEVEHRGVEGEAMMLLGPSADWEARGHLEASVRAGRVPPEYLETADSDQHPLFVLGGWDTIWRDALDHDEPNERLTVATAVDYLDRQITYMATYPHAPFEDFARDLRRCVGHLEAVLHDGEQVDKGAPCMTCKTDLQRVRKGDRMPWTRQSDQHPETAREDGWACPRCRKWHTENQYRTAVMALHTSEAEWLTDSAMERRTGIKAATVRSWARVKDDGLEPITKRVDAGRVVYSVAEVRERAQAKGLLRGVVA